jgi:hypothetical protein
MPQYYVWVNGPTQGCVRTAAATLQAPTPQPTEQMAADLTARLGLPREVTTWAGPWPRHMPTVSRSMVTCGGGRRAGPQLGRPAEVGESGRSPAAIKGRGRARREAPC